MMHADLRGGVNCILCNAPMAADAVIASATSATDDSTTGFCTACVARFTGTCADCGRTRLLVPNGNGAYYPNICRDCIWEAEFELAHQLAIYDRQNG